MKTCDPSVPRVSVIMPIYNAAAFLPETLGTLAAQEWPDLEVIGIDDGSSDDSCEVFQRFCPQARLLRQANQGPSRARNAGIGAATGEYITFLDADDLWPAGKLARQVARLRTAPELMATMGYMQLFTDAPAGEGGGLRREWGTPFFLFLLGGMVARAELFRPERVGGFDAERFPFNGEDTDWFLRAWESGLPLEIVDDTTLFYRRRTGSLTSNADDTKRGFAGLMMTSLRRRRDASGKVRPLPNSLRLPAGLALGK